MVFYSYTSRGTIHRMLLFQTIKRERKDRGGESASESDSERERECETDRDRVNVSDR